MIDNDQLEERQGNEQLTEQEQPETRNNISIDGTVPVEVVSAVPKLNETHEMGTRGDTEIAGISKDAMNELRFVSPFTIKPVPRIQRNESTRELAMDQRLLQHRHFTNKRFLNLKKRRKKKKIKRFQNKQQQLKGTKSERVL